MVNILTPIKGNFYERVLSYFNCRLFLCFCFGLFLFVMPLQLLAEGSKELTANGGNRAFLLSSTSGSSSFPFPTLGTMKVYAKAGEVINIGSSAQGISLGTINLRAPNGAIYSSGTGTTTGQIANRTQELAGPLPNAGGYTPYTQTVLAGQEGIWEIDFISPIGDANATNPSPIAASANWVQSASAYIAAFDISVRNVTNTAFLTGRVFTNVFSGILGTFNVGFNGIFNILTNDGYQYILDNNGQAGNGFTFFVNNKGFKTGTTASYQSVNTSPATNVQDPRADDTPTDITHKIFFNTPATDMPATANVPGNKTTWLLGVPVPPTTGQIGFVGIEGTSGRAGTYPLGTNFTFTTSGNGTYSIIIDVNQNGVFTDAIDRKLTGAVSSGTNRIFWDGLDGLGNKVPANTLTLSGANVLVTTNAGEVHFPFFDVERNVNGLKLTRLNGYNSPNDTLYWDDTPITRVGTASNPVKNLTGISSVINGHKWGAATVDPNNDADFGNNKSIDTWSFIAIAPVTTALTFKLLEADLAVDSVVAAAACAGQPVTYKITVSNKGPSDVTGAKFHFTFPAAISNLSVISAATTGVSALSAGAITATAYDANLDMANGAVTTIFVTGLVDVAFSGNISVTASMIRPADVTDPDATNPDATAPTDALAECNSLPSGVGCNNIKTNTSAFAAASQAGADQKVFINTTATMAALTTGTWSVVSGNPALAIINNPTSAGTTISGLTAAGVYQFLYTNASGCTDLAVVTVVPSEIDIPNIITPNGDGKNDTFTIKNLDSYPGSQITISNRWGNEVYHAIDYKNDWNGSGLADGTYYYILNRKGKLGEITTYKGWVFIKRNN